MMKNKTIMVSVVDANPTNQRALTVLLRQLVSVGQTFAEVVLLCPSGLKLLPELKEEVTRGGLIELQYPFFINDDPYVVKFLLANFISEFSRDFDSCIYLDPDHLLLAPLVLPAERDQCLWVSSERRMLPDPGFGIGIHNNTSLIFGNWESWRRAISEWVNQYLRIHDSVPTRYREEIAFCLSAAQNGVRLLAVPTSTQSYFGSWASDCALFHYGGEYDEAKNIKGLIRDSTSPEHIESQLEQWIRSKLISVNVCQPS